ncbi:hypothetical protein OE88DRAFT_1081375 [Heliocybe sulcata]|uniref:Uncharacterized protein n=1 Tax=Heliocybe sulcata TaxID=5364 RepID=A0A5C3MWG3_9AGAM|nr:hypothetical protein OE88DRAFT_1081375 [Heliocybe sulcata]
MMGVRSKIIKALEDSGMSDERLVAHLAGLVPSHSNTTVEALVRTNFVKLCREALPPPRLAAVAKHPPMSCLPWSDNDRHGWVDGPMAPSPTAEEPLVTRKPEVLPCPPGGSGSPEAEGDKETPALPPGPTDCREGDTGDARVAASRKRGEESQVIAEIPLTISRHPPRKRLCTEAPEALLAEGSRAPSLAIGSRVWSAVNPHHPIGFIQAPDKTDTETLTLEQLLVHSGPSDVRQPIVQGKSSRVKGQATAYALTRG